MFTLQTVIFTLLSLVATLLVIGALRAAWCNGVVDGYGFATEPINPGYRAAGDYLFETMRHRWPELCYRPRHVEESEKERRTHALFLRHCTDQSDSEIKLIARRLPMQTRVAIIDALRQRDIHTLVDLFVSNALYRELNMLAILNILSDAILDTETPTEEEQDG